MSLFLLEPGELGGDGTARLAAPRARPLFEAGLAVPGAGFEVGVAGGRIGTGIVRAARGGEVLLSVRLERDPPPPLPVTLVLGLPRPKAMRRSLDAAASLGVKRIVLLRTWRVARSDLSATALRPEHLRAVVGAAVARARDTVLPEVRLEPRFRPFVEDRLPGMLAAASGFVADADRGGGVPLPPPAPAVVAVGPERGFTDWEYDRLVAAGMRGVGLGPRVLRVEHAVAALLGRWLP